jgi:hypothetical protein
MTNRADMFGVGLEFGTVCITLLRRVPFGSTVRGMSDAGDIVPGDELLGEDTVTRYLLSLALCMVTFMFSLEPEASQGH